MDRTGLPVSVSSLYVQQSSCSFTSTRQTDQSAAATSEVSLGDGSWFVEADGVRTDLNY